MPDKSSATKHQVIWACDSPGSTCPRVQSGKRQPCRRTSNGLRLTSRARTVGIGIRLARAICTIGVWIRLANPVSAISPRVRRASPHCTIGVGVNILAGGSDPDDHRTHVLHDSCRRAHCLRNVGGWRFSDCSGCQKWRDCGRQGTRPRTDRMEVFITDSGMITKHRDRLQVHVDSRSISYRYPSRCKASEK